jgi:hypothetical protein
VSYSIKIDSNIKQLLAGLNTIYDDYTTGERLLTGTENILFGLGSALQGDKRWWIGGTVELAGVGLLISGLSINPETVLNEYGWYYGPGYTKVYTDEALTERDNAEKRRKGLITMGAAICNTVLLS